jgi:hypothetical protein
MADAPVDHADGIAVVPEDLPPATGGLEVTIGRRGRGERR